MTVCFQRTSEHVVAIEELTMHDLVHDLATIIAGDELIVPDAGAKTTWSGLERCYSRHMRLASYQKQSKALKKIPGKIRSLNFTDCSAPLLQKISFSESKYLRVLDVSGCSIEGKPHPSNKLLPSSIHQLMLLRYLDSSGLPITTLPKSLHKLQNMQTLIMSNCALKTVSDKIGRLLRLSYLDLSNNSSLTKLPLSLEQLSELFFLNLSGCSKLKELPESIHKLERLQHVDMSRCTVLRKLPDEFGSLPKLLFLNLSSCSKLVKLPDNLNLKSLEHLNLSNCHKLHSLTSDFGNLRKLEFLNLCDCYKIQILPDSFCQLEHLKELDLADCHDLKELPECFGFLSELHYLNIASCSKLQLLPESFSDLFKLERLNLSYCVRLEKLCSLFGNLKLQVLDIRGCHNLRDLPKGLGNMTTLTRLRISRGHFPTLVRARDILARLKLPGSTIHDVHEKDNGECSSIVELGQLTCHALEIRQLENVKCPEEAERCKLRDNPELRELGLHWTHKSIIVEKTKEDMCKVVLEHLIPPRILEDFTLTGYISKDFPKWMIEISTYLPYLMSIRLISLTTCDSLPPFGQLPNLRLLHLMNIPNIRKVGKEFFGEEGRCRKLRVIELKSLENLDEWWTTRSCGEEEEFLIPNLHRLHVANCPKLKFMPYPPKSIYWYLEKSDEVLPALGFGQLSSPTLPFHATLKNCNLSPDKWGRLEHLATLEELKVLGDRSLRTLPEVNPCLPCLRYLHLHLVGLEVLPEWLEQLTTLEEFRIFFCPNLTSLPRSIEKLTALKKLTIRGCPRLVESCQGEDAHKICHIPEVVLNNKKFVPAQLTEDRGIKNLPKAQYI
jgi:Leucine-rich repeat (LRR) protein